MLFKLILVFDVVVVFSVIFGGFVGILLFKLMFGLFFLFVDLYGNKFFGIFCIVELRLIVLIDLFEVWDLVLGIFELRLFFLDCVRVFLLFLF